MTTSTGRSFVGRWPRNKTWVTEGYKPVGVVTEGFVARHATAAQGHPRIMAEDSAALIPNLNIASNKEGPFGTGRIVVTSGTGSWGWPSSRRK